MRHLSNTYHIISTRLVILIFIMISCFTNVYTQRFAESKIKGISFLGPHEPNLEQHMIDAIDSIHADWIAIIPEATLDRGSLQLWPDHKNENWSETKEGVTEMIRLSQQSGKRVMLKPHIVLDTKYQPNALLNELASYINLAYEKITDKTYGAEWRGDFVAASEADWQIFEASYTRYIISYAELAEAMNVDIFCIGTELRESAIRRPQYWKSLIKKVRGIYNGDIIYSANWDEYESITFWKDLDYIGTNAYYPISESETPSIAEAFENWRTIRKDLYTISKRHNRKVLVTEYGYRNVSFTGMMPWLHVGQVERPKINNQAQYNLYEAFYKAIWNESWIVGGFGWNWTYNSQHFGNTDFSVQGKPAMKVIASYYKK